MGQLKTGAQGQSAPVFPLTFCDENLRLCTRIRIIWPDFPTLSIKTGKNGENKLDSRVIFH